MPFRFVNLPPRVAVLAAVRWCGWRRWPSFPPDFAGNTPAAGWLSFPYCPNMERNVPIFASSLSFRPLSVSDLTISAGFGCFVCGGCRLPDGHGMGPGHPPPLAVSAGQLFSQEHRPPGDSSPLLPFGRCWAVVIVARLSAVGGCCCWYGVMVCGLWW